MVGMYELQRQRFWARVAEADENGHRLWTMRYDLAVGKTGKYGRWTPVRDGGSLWGKQWRTSRLAWFFTYGPIPPGLTVDHECRVTLCCEPAHLRLRTWGDNASDNSFKRQTHCINGHPFDEANTYVRTDRGRGDHRLCRECRRVNSARYAARLRGY